MMDKKQKILDVLTNGSFIRILLTNKSAELLGGALSTVSCALAILKDKINNSASKYFNL